MPSDIHKTFPVIQKTNKGLPSGSAFEICIFPSTQSMCPWPGLTQTAPVFFKAYVDSKSAEKTGAGKAPSEAAHMKRFVDSMLKDIRASHKSREEQLAGAARGYKKRLQNLVKTHENLLIAYR